jgi:exodeoxyribonuclease V gamma subunit
LANHAQTLHSACREWIDAYPMISDARAIRLLLDGCIVEDSFIDLRALSDSSTTFLQLQVRAGNLIKDKQVRGKVLTDLWVKHLAGCAMGWTLTSVLVGLDGEVRYLPMDAHVAITHLNALLRLYQQGLSAPLPIACETACAYWQEQQKEGVNKDPHHKAASVFNEGFNTSGERLQSAYLSLAFKDYAEIKAGVEDLSDALYGAMLKQVEII